MYNCNVVFYTLSRYAGVPNQPLWQLLVNTVYTRCGRLLELSSLLYGSFFTETETPAQIPTVSTRPSFQKASPSVHAGPVRVYKPRTSALTDSASPRSPPPYDTGLFNARSISNKSASIQHWTACTGLNVAALVETWHDDAASPHLIACPPPGFKLVEAARARTTLHIGIRLPPSSKLARHRRRRIRRRPATLRACRLAI